MSIVDAIARGTMTTLVISTVGILGRASKLTSDHCGSQTCATGSRKRCHLPNFLLLLAFSVVFRTLAIAEIPEVRRVLVFNDFDQIASPGIALLDQGIFAALSRSRYQVEWYSESLAANLFTDEVSQRRILDGYIRKYEDRKPDLIIAVGPASLQFMVELHENFFPGVPIVFCGSSEDMLENLKPDSRFTGVWGVVQPEETLTAALRLQPSTKHVVVVGGAGTYDRYLEDIVKKSLRNYESRLEFTYLTDLEMPTLLRRVGQLPRNTIVLYTSIFRDAAGRHFIDANQSSPAVIDASNAPVFILFDVNFGTGAVGGDIISFASDGNVAGHMAVRILDGEQPRSIPVVKNANVWTFDWRALRRWGLKETDLPPASIVLDRQLTLWESYKWYIIAGFSLMVVEIVLIAALLWQRARRTKAEQALREGEERLRLAAQAGRMFAYSWDAATDAIERSGEAIAILGVKNDQAATGAAISAMVHPEDKERLEVALAKLTPDNPMLQVTYRIIRPDGTVTWLERNSRAYFDQQGKMKRIVGMIADVTERKTAEDRLQEYEEAVEGAEDMIGVIDRQYRYLLANRQYLKMRNLTREQVVGHFITEVLSKEIFETVIKPKLDECFQGKVVRYEKKFSYATGGERDLLLSYFPIEGAIGIDRVACILHDITDRKRAEEALLEMNRTLQAQGSLLQAREELLRVFVKNVPAAVAMLDRHMRYLQVSDRWCADYSLDNSKILGRSHYEIFPDLPERWKEIHRRGLAGETLRAEEDRWDRDSGTTWSRWEIRPWKNRDGQPGGILIFSEDITRRKQIEESLRESEDRLRLLLDSTAEAIYGIDLEHRCTFCNPACLRTLGYEHVDQMLGKNMHSLIHHTRADGTLFSLEACRVHRVTRTGEGVHAEDEVFWRANGTSFPAEYWSYPQRKGTDVVGAVVAFIDITERKLAEAALANVSRKLIEGQEQERSRIARELHDDIGQRLALLAVELQQLHGDPLVLPKVRSRLGKLQKQTSGIAEDIQSLSHELHSAKLQYLGIVGAMRGFCREFGEQQKVEIDFQSYDLPSPVSADISLCFFRVLQEALHNSAKHSGVRHFDVRLWGTSDEIHLTVMDSGAGFDREAAKTSRGLGLISMEERLRLVKGTLSIDSQPKRGTTIHARVPLDAEHVSQRAAG